ncbi:hypothetical protein LEP1GSC203_3675 [Leptospira terpstrae serovar Hualin str. LT 11-33 = ATCC 700639]|uniref:Uncharacterized protein n=1 Tax=Leptospira terpstrae serovar Hualin str. LT 11-33 = ATCC 700639 TaxID=1257025 RepID=N1W372_9LEPT|nr:hypothetical protein LEP1GSC203_3675 [Leptospira terpstrae serovar Hualin str. LT 11-33 = ATCC 700639]
MEAPSTSIGLRDKSPFENYSLFRIDPKRVSNRLILDTR